jgi:predicted metal-dependent RNase
MMAVAPKRMTRSLVLDKQYVRQLAEEMNRRIEFVPDPTATAEEAQALSIASGVRPEDNEFSTEIVRRRDRSLDEQGRT